MEERDVLFLELLWYLKRINVDDSAIDLWLAVLTGDLEMLKKVSPRVSNPDITDGQLLQKYQECFKNEEIAATLAKWLVVVRKPPKGTSNA